MLERTERGNSLSPYSQPEKLREGASVRYGRKRFRQAILQITRRDTPKTVLNALEMEEDSGKRSRGMTPGARQTTDEK